jgi:hypothetical protein
MNVTLRKKRIIKAALILLALYVIWLGSLLLLYKEPRPGDRGRGGPPYEIQGVYHIHTKFSDGRRSPDETARIASLKSLDFIILTDHGNPNLASLASQGWKDKVLVLAGSEISSSRGHLVALDFRLPSGSFSQNAEQASRDVESLGGFTIIAHPFSKTRWSWGGPAEYSGLEIIDSDTMIKKNFLSALPYLPTLLVKPGLYMLKILDRPVETLRKWDELSMKSPWYGYLSADAHLLYSALFSCFRLHVILPEPLSQDFETAKAQVFSALRKGRFYNGIDSARSAGGFLYWAENREAKYAMGSVVALDSTAPLSLRVRTPFPFEAETRFIRDGETVLSSRAKDASLTPRQPGVYRVEIYLEGWSPLARNIPWIISNPIFLKEAKR